MMRFRLKDLLERPGAPSQAELARRIGMPRQQINRLVNGDIERIDLKTLDRIYTALGCRQVDELIAYEPERPDVSSFRERFIQQLVSLTLSPLQGDHRGIYTDPEVRQAAERFFDQHIAKDVASGSLLASLHMRLMREMRAFVTRHGARDVEVGLGELQTRQIERLVRQIPLEENEQSN